MVRRVWFVVVAVALMLGVGAVAYASIPDSGGVIHGCRRNLTGVLRVIDTDAGGACISGETALNWSQTGPAGPTGATGATGPAGPAGSPGLAGVHIVTTHAAGSLTVQSRCPTGETALGVALTISGGGSPPWSATPVFAANGVTPVGYDVLTQTVSDVHLTCAQAA